MTRPRPVTVLRFALAFVMGSAGLRLALSGHTSHLHVILGAVEALAALLLLLPVTLRIGAWLLGGCLVVATIVHLHTGEPPSPIFLVYAAGLWTVAADARK